MRRTADANARPARAPKKPLRFADDEKYATEIAPWALRAVEAKRDQAAERRAAESEQAQPGAMTGEEFVAREQQAADAAGLSPQRAEAPLYKRDARAKKVTLPPGWTASKPDEVEQYLKNLNNVELNKIVRLHGYAFFSGGCVQTVGQAAAKKWFLGHGLVVGPWHKPGFPGMCNSEALAQQRFRKLSQADAQKRHDDAVFERLDNMGLDKDEKKHDASYRDHEADDLLVAAFNRGEDVPKGDERALKVQEWLPPTIGTCVDCGWRRKLVRVEHANGGPDDGKRRVPPCPDDNTGARTDCDVAIDAAYEADETLDEDAYAKILGLRLAYARPDGASAEDLEILAQAERLAADVRAPEDQEALRFGSSLRGRRISNDLGPTLEDARAKFREEEAARVAARRERDAAAKAHSATLPPVKVGTRVVVIDEDSRHSGRRGVVQGWRGITFIAVLLAGDASDRCFYRRQLRIDASRKPAARKPAARKPSAKPSARKPSARKPAAKPAARKPSVRKSRK